MSYERRVARVAACGPDESIDNRRKSIRHLIAEEIKMPTKSTSKRSPAKKSSSRQKSTRKYSPGAGKNVETEMKAMKQGKLRSGRSGKKVTSRKQAIAIGLSKARKEGKKVPKKKG
jgi:uncharacterized protein DUF6496